MSKPKTLGNQLPEYKQALQQQEQGLFDEAEASFRAALELAPNDVPVLFRLACLLTNELERHEEARELFETAIGVDSNHLNSHFCLADLLACHLARCEEAEHHYREALRINPRNLNTHFNLGALLTAELGRHKEAEGHYRAALCIDPEDADTHFNLAELLKDHLGRPQEAEKHYNEALRIDPNDKQVHCNLARLLTDHLNRHSEAEAHFKQALQLDWEYAEAHVNFGLLLTEMLARHQEAETHFKEALKLTPDDLDTHFNLAELLTDHLSKHQEAEEHYHTALELHPDDFDTHFNLAHLLSTHMERHAEAEHHLREAMRIEPEDRRVKRTLATLLSVHLDKKEEADVMLESIREPEPAEISNISNAAYQDLLVQLETVRNELRASQAEIQQANNRKSELATQLKVANKEMSEMMHSNFELKDKLAQTEAAILTNTSTSREKQLQAQLTGVMEELADEQKKHLEVQQILHSIQDSQSCSEEPDGGATKGHTLILQELQQAQMDIVHLRSEARAAVQSKEKAEADLLDAKAKVEEVQTEMDALLEGAGAVSEEETAKIKNLREELETVQSDKASIANELQVYKDRIQEVEDHAATQNELMDELIAGQANGARVEGELLTSKARASELEGQLEACLAELNAFREAETAAEMVSRESEATPAEVPESRTSGLRAPGSNSKPLDRGGAAPPRRRQDTAGNKSSTASGPRAATPTRSRRVAAKDGAAKSPGDGAKKVPSYMQPTGNAKARVPAGKSKPGEAAVKAAKEVQALEKQVKQLHEQRMQLERDLKATQDEVQLLKAAQSIPREGSSGASSAELEAARQQAQQAREEAGQAKQEAQQAQESTNAARKGADEAMAKVAALQSELDAAAAAGQGSAKIGKALLGAKRAVSEAAQGLRADTKAMRAVVEAGKSSMIGSFANLHKSIEQSIQQAASSAEASCGMDTELMRDKYRIECMKRKKLYNQLQELRGNLRVYCRLRPPTQVESAEGVGGIQPDTELGMIKIKDDSKGVGKRDFEFDRVYTPGLQEAVFEDVDPLITSVLDGYNVCVFAYGQTGSGKTFTMEGPVENPGLSRRAVAAIFREAEARQEEEEATMELSMLEVYLDDIVDLLTKDHSKKLSIMNDKSGDGIVVLNLTSKTVNTVDEVLEQMTFGTSNRSVGKTDMNAHSSRSHLVLKLTVRLTNKTSGAQSVGKLSLVDLAGSERVGKSGAEGNRLKEAQAINKSLSALGGVVRTLANGGAHVPYRDSKLTHVLADSIGGDSKTLMFCNISPRDRDIQETMCSLQFAVQAKEVTSGPAKRHVNAASDGTPRNSPRLGGQKPGSPMTPNSSQERRKAGNARNSPIPRER